MTDPCHFTTDEFSHLFQAENISRMPLYQDISKTASLNSQMHQCAQIISMRQFFTEFIIQRANGNAADRKIVLFKINKSIR